MMIRILVINEEYSIMKYIKFFMLAAAMTAAMSCVKENAPENKPEENAKLVEMTFTATSDDSQTKAAFGEETYPAIVWEGNETIAVLAANTDQEFKTSSTGKVAEFTGLANIEDNEFYAVYPYDEAITLSDDILTNVKVPAVQTVTEGSFDPKAFVAVAKSSDKKNFTFKAVGGFLKFQVGDEDVKSVTVIANAYTEGGAQQPAPTIAGTAGVSWNNDNPTHGVSGTWISSSSSVKLTEVAEGDKFTTGKNYFIIMRANSCPGGITVYVEYDNGEVYSISSTKQLFTTGVQNMIKNLGTFTKAKMTKVDDLYSLYTMGYDLVIGDKTFNVASHGEATLINADTELTSVATSIYFVDCNSTLTYNVATNVSKLIIIGNSADQKSRLAAIAQFKILPNDANDTFLIYNMDITGGDFNFFTLNGDGAYKYVGFINCKIDIGTYKKPLYYMSNSGRYIDAFNMENCDFVASGDSQKIIQFGTNSTAKYSNITFKNNIFYSASDSGAGEFYLVNNGGSTPVGNLVVEQNSFANVYPTNNSKSTHYIVLKSVDDYICRNNLFYLPLYEDNKYAAVLTVTPNTNSCEGNLLYKTSTATRIRVFNPSGDYVETTNVREKVVTSVNLSNGTIVPVSAGATR